MFWGRVLELTIGQPGNQAVVVDQSFRVVFSVSKTLKKSPNRSSIQVYNAAPGTRDVMHQPNNVAVLKTGYSEEDGLILAFTGDILDVSTYTVGPDTITEIALADGFSQMRETVVSVGFAPGTPALTVLRSVAAEMGLVVRPMPEIKERSYPNGFSFCGQAHKALDKVCEYMGAEWSIQNSELQVMVNGGVMKQQAVLLSAATGMIGTPEPNNKTFSEKRARERGLIGREKVAQVIVETEAGKKHKKFRVFGYSVSSYLIPHLQPGAYVKLEAKNAGGFFRVVSLEHTGDTFGDDWRTDMVLEVLTA